MFKLKAFSSRDSGTSSGKLDIRFLYNRPREPREPDCLCVSSMSCTSGNSKLIFPTNSSACRMENSSCECGVWRLVDWDLWGYGETIMRGGQNYLLLAMDMAKAGGPLSVEGFHTNLNIPSPLPTTLVFR
jgi:hypothetical protein